MSIKLFLVGIFFYLTWFYVNQKLQVLKVTRKKISPKTIFIISWVVGIYSFNCLDRLLRDVVGILRYYYLPDYLQIQPATFKVIYDIINGQRYLVFPI